MEFKISDLVIIRRFMGGGRRYKAGRQRIIKWKSASSLSYCSGGSEKGDASRIVNG